MSDEHPERSIDAGPSARTGVPILPDGGTGDAEPSDEKPAIEPTLNGSVTDKGRSEPSEPSDEPDADGSTSDTSQRWWLTNDLLAGLLVTSLVASVAIGGAGHLDLEAVPEPVVWTYVGSVGSAIVWTFGRDAVEAWRASE